MNKIFSAYDTAKSRALRGDFNDRLHSNVTVTIFLAILLLIVSRQYSGNAIACWLPKQFSGDQESYIHQFCWINNTYYYPNEKDPDRFDPSTKYVIHYYQFILFILSGQIALFFLPSLLWKSLVADSGSYINKLLDSVDRSKVFEKECAKDEVVPQKDDTPKFPMQTVNEESAYDTSVLNDSVVSDGSLEKQSLLLSSDVSNQFKNDFQKLKSSLSRNSSIISRKESTKKSFDAQNSNIVDMPESSPEHEEKPRRNLFAKIKLKKKFGKVLIKPIRGVKNLALYYFGLKFINVLNVLAQLFGLRFIFGNEFYRYGYDYVVKALSNEDPLFMSKQFPIVTICDYYTHQNLRRVHWNSSQCLLAINIFIEKFYVFIWFWLYVLLILTVFNIFSWFLEIYSSTRTGFLYKYLRIKEKMNENWNDRLKYDSYARSPSIKKQGFSGKNSLVNSDSPVTKENVEVFYGQYLGYDGLVMMHIIKAVAGDVIFIELLNGLWTEFLKRKTE